MITMSDVEERRNWVQSGVERIKGGKKRAVILLGLVAIALGALGWIWHSQQNMKVAAEEQVLVRTQKIEASNAKNQYIYSGEVRGRYESQLAFQVGGKIVRRFVELGSAVKPGDALMQIDAKDIRQTVNIASAQVNSAESQMKLARNNLERYRRLYEQGAVSKAQYEQYLSAYEVSAAGANQASAQYSQGANQLDYSILRADKAGIVSAISAEAGQVAGAGQAVVMLVQDGEREVEINVPESRSASMRQATDVNVKLWALPDVVIKGKVREIAPMADMVTRTYRVRISLIEPPSEVTLGMTASVEISDSQQKSGAICEIPLSAVYQSGQQPAVWVLQNDSVTLRPVQTGKYGKTTLQVTGGIQPGDTIVIAGVHKLREGQKVRLAGGEVE
jgi:RND family efflux transporter MFP subunit